MVFIYVWFFIFALAKIVDANVSCNGDLVIEQLGTPSGPDCKVYVGRDRRQVVTEIKLENCGLSGTISPCLGQLSRLKKFSILGNSVGGTIPPLANMSRLKEFIINDNQVSGTIPDLSGLVGLTELSLARNNLHGTVPPLHNSKNLKKLDLCTNFVEGDLTDVGIERLTLLCHLSLNDNDELTGPFPDVSNLTHLTELSLARTRFSGTFPTLTGLTQLVKLDVYGTDLEGVQIASNVLDNGDFQYYIYDTNIKVKPVWHETVANGHPIVGKGQRTSVSQEETRALGAVLDALSLTVEFCAKNQGLCPRDGCAARDLSRAVFGCANGHVVSLRLVGHHEQYGSVLTRHIVGTLSPEIVHLSHLRTLFISDVKLGGTLPTNLFMLPKLFDMRITNTRVHGNIPPLGSSLSLEEVRLQDNLLDGDVPKVPPNVMLFACHNNSLTGDVHVFGSDLMLNGNADCSLVWGTGENNCFQHVPTRCLRDNAPSGCPNGTPVPVVDFNKSGITTDGQSLGVTVLVIFAIALLSRYWYFTEKNACPDLPSPGDQTAKVADNPVALRSVGDSASAAEAVSSLPLTNANVLDLRLTQRLTSDEAQLMRNHLHKNAKPASEQPSFADADMLRTTTQVFDRAVDRCVTLASVADAIDRGAGKKALANELRLCAAASAVMGDVSTSTSPVVLEQDQGHSPPAVSASHLLDTVIDEVNIEMPTWLKKGGTIIDREVLSRGDGYAVFYMTEIIKKKLKANDLIVHMVLLVVVNDTVKRHTVRRHVSAFASGVPECSAQIVQDAQAKFGVSIRPWW